MTPLRKAFSLLDSFPRQVDLRIVFGLFSIALIFSFAGANFAQDEESDESLFRLEFDKEEIAIPCPAECRALSGADRCDDNGMSVDVRVVRNTAMFDRAPLWFEFVPEIGSVTVRDGITRWNLPRASEGIYWLKVEVNQGFETLDVVNKSVELRACDCDCSSTLCASFAVDASLEAVSENEIISFRAVQDNYFSPEEIELIWQVENGSIVSGAGTNILKVRAGSAEQGYLKVSLEAVQNSQECRRAHEVLVPVSKKNESIK